MNKDTRREMRLSATQRAQQDAIMRELGLNYAEATHRAWLLLATSLGKSYDADAPKQGDSVKRKA